jgi:hypothetical protein
MLFRVLLLCGSILCVLGIWTQVLWPAVRSRRLFPLFRGESRLQRAERFRIESLEKKQAAEREAEALRVAAEADSVDAEVIQRLTKP